MKLKKLAEDILGGYLDEWQMLNENIELSDKINNIIESEEFKKWFNNSKIVNDNGNPLVVYHGSRETTIREFKPNVDGIWFSDNLKVSQSYSTVSGLRQKRYSKKLQKILDYANAKKIKNIRELFNELKDIGFIVDITMEKDSSDYYYVKNYYVLTDKNGEKYKLSEYLRPIDLKYDIIKRGKNYACFLKSTNPFVINAKGANWDNIRLNNKIVTTKDISLYAKDSGYDGVIINNIYEDGIKCNVYVVYDNSNIKIIN
jgi:hypothetical protein